MRKRLYKFGIGILIGTLFSYLFFKDHDITGWMPNQRILATIQKINTADYSEKVKCQIECYQLSEADISGVYFEGDVDFGVSKTRTEPRVYLINYVNPKNQTIQGTFEIFKSDTLMNIEEGDKTISVKVIKADDAYLVDIKLLGQLKECLCE